MMRSLYSGVSGLQNHQTRMDVIGNNISNVNTTGFKRGRVNFQDMISQQIAGAAKPTEELGGVNPKDVGLGMTIATIEQVFTHYVTHKEIDKDELSETVQELCVFIKDHKRYILSVVIVLYVHYCLLPLSKA